MPSSTPFDDSPLKIYPKGPYGKREPCYFCEKDDSQTYVFQGVAICYTCNKKVIDRIKLILKLE